MIDLFFVERALDSPVASGVVVGSLFAGYRLSAGRACGHCAWRAWAYVAAIVGMVSIANRIWDRIQEPEQWDSLAFWLYSRVAFSGSNPYDLASFAAVDLPFQPTDSFVRETLQVGLPYPPQFLVIVTPFGLLDFPGFLVAWYLVHMICFGIAVWLLGSAIADRGEKKSAILLVLAALLWLPATYLTVSLGQTNFMLLLVGAFLWVRPSLKGYTVAAGMIVKPWFVFLLPWAWRWGGVSRLFHAAIVLSIASLIVISFQGIWIFFDYLSGEVHSRLPQLLLTQNINQSLLAVLSRLRESWETGAGPPLSILYLACAVPLLLISGRRLIVSRDDLIGLAISIQVALLLYPSAHKHYCVLAMIPLLVLWVRFKATPYQAIGAGVGIALYVVLSEGVTFWANFALWGTLITTDLWIQRKELRAHLDKSVSA